MFLEGCSGSHQIAYTLTASSYACRARARRSIYRRETAITEKKAIRELLFCIDNEFASVPPKNEKKRKNVSVEVAVYDLDGELIVDARIKYDQSVSEPFG